jgi:7-keto-8-aminopelargonate synthetase-like enzyme
MDGDEAPLGGVVELAERWGAMVMVDEAHAAGCTGPEGRGLVGRERLEGRVDVQMGTFSKALGCQGGYVAGSREVIDWLVNRARSFVYSTAVAPAFVEAIGAAVLWVRGAEGEARRVRLEQVVGAFRAGFRRELGGRLVGDAARLFAAS